MRAKSFCLVTGLKIIQTLEIQEKLLIGCYRNPNSTQSKGKPEPVLTELSVIIRGLVSRHRLISNTEF